MHPNSFKESLAVASAVIFFLLGLHNGHLRESVDDQENTVVSMLSRRKARHVIHGDGFPRLTRGKKRSIEALLLDGWFGNGAGSAGLDLLLDILSNIRLIEILLQYDHCFLDPKMPNNPTVVRFPNHLGTLA